MSYTSGTGRFISISSIVGFAVHFDFKPFYYIRFALTDTNIQEWTYRSKEERDAELTVINSMIVRSRKTLR